MVFHCLKNYRNNLELAPITALQLSLFLPTGAHYGSGLYIPKFVLHNSQTFCFAVFVVFWHEIPQKTGIKGEKTSIKTRHNKYPNRHCKSLYQCEFCSNIFYYIFHTHTIRYFIPTNIQFFLIQNSFFVIFGLMVKKNDESRCISLIFSVFALFF